MIETLSDVGSIALASGASSAVATWAVNKVHIGYLREKAAVQEAQIGTLFASISALDKIADRALRAATRAHKRLDDLGGRDVGDCD